jgi:hypothetical protein
VSYRMRRLPRSCSCCLMARLVLAAVYGVSLLISILFV